LRYANRIEIFSDKRVGGNYFDFRLMGYVDGEKVYNSSRIMNLPYYYYSFGDVFSHPIFSQYEMTSDKIDVHALWTSHFNILTGGNLSTLKEFLWKTQGLSGEVKIDIKEKKVFWHSHEPEYKFTSDDCEFFLD
jgi:hypothetical protein